MLLAQWHGANHRVGCKRSTYELLTFSFQTKNIPWETVTPGSSPGCQAKTSTTNLK